MKINLGVRLKNPYFWIGIFGVIMTVTGAKPEMFTSWEILYKQVMQILQNPFLFGSAVISVMGVLIDPTTKGISDSDEVLNLKNPKE